jgi:hypothetical protein
MIDPEEGMAYADILAIARRAEALGFEALYRSGHYASVFDREDSARLPQPSSTSWHSHYSITPFSDVHRLGAGRPEHRPRPPLHRPGSSSLQIQAGCDPTPIKVIRRRQSAYPKMDSSLLRIFS